MKRFDETGNCPARYEFVNGYMQGDHWIKSFCRKIRKFRFFADPEQREMKLREEKMQESLRLAQEAVSSRGNDNPDFSEDKL
ncbi:hypothetical protein Thermo_00072 [Thermoplasmatales archaeon]|nr:hypothetical protein Thermo_00072 [Thermoplasmatales archaeon]